jgi:hypothetical protein
MTSNETTRNSPLLTPLDGTATLLLDAFLSDPQTTFWHNADRPFFTPVDANGVIDNAKNYPTLEPFEFHYDKLLVIGLKETPDTTDAQSFRIMRENMMWCSHKWVIDERASIAYILHEGALLSYRLVASLKFSEKVTPLRWCLGWVESLVTLLCGGKDAELELAGISKQNPLPLTGRTNDTWQGPGEIHGASVEDLEEIVGGADRVNEFIRGINWSHFYQAFRDNTPANWPDPARVIPSPLSNGLVPASMLVTIGYDAKKMETGWEHWYQLLSSQTALSTSISKLPCRALTQHDTEGWLSYCGLEPKNTTTYNIDGEIYTTKSGDWGRIASRGLQRKQLTATV